jgi:hypothetical protein
MDREGAGREEAAGIAAACWALPPARTVPEPLRGPGQAAFWQRYTSRSARYIADGWRSLAGTYLICAITTPPIHSQTPRHRRRRIHRPEREGVEERSRHRTTGHHWADALPASAATHVRCARTFCAVPQGELPLLAGVAGLTSTDACRTPRRAATGTRCPARPPMLVRAAPPLW